MLKDVEWNCKGGILIYELRPNYQQTFQTISTNNNYMAHLSPTHRFTLRVQFIHSEA